MRPETLHQNAGSRIRTIPRRLLHGFMGMVQYFYEVLGNDLYSQNETGAEIML